MTDYAEFLRQKIKLASFNGFDVPMEQVNPNLKPHTRDIVRWAVQATFPFISPSVRTEVAAASAASTYLQKMWKQIISHLWAHGSYHDQLLADRFQEGMDCTMNCEQGCNGCDECTNYDDDQEPECPRCHDDGRDPWTDYLLPCPLCQGGQKP